MSVVEFPALDRLPVPLFRSTQNGAITWVNEAWTVEVGKAIESLWFDAFTEIDEPRARDLWIQCMEQNTPVSLSSSAAGSLGETRWFELILQPALVDGKAEMMGSLIDVTEQTVAAAETHAILDTAVDGIVIIDEQGNIQTFNQAACELFGYAADEVIGRNIDMLMTSDDATKHDGYLSNYLQSGHASIIGVGRELVAKTANNEQVPIYLAVSDIQLDGRRRFAGIVRDLTEQYAAREALASQREKLAHVGRLSTMGEMTASIAHEINQPLTAISMYAQASLKLMEREDSFEQIKSALEKLNTQALRAGAVIERIQRFARAQETSREIIDINDLVTDLLNLAGSDARMHNIELALDLGLDLPAVFADPVQIQQVILNLIRNGIDAMNEIGCRNGRTITLRTSLVNEEADAEYLEVLVSDQGPGVTEDQSPLLFTPFHTTKKDGMGMGLSICRSIISEHGGELSYRNNAEHGASFYFTLSKDHD
jgi:two-component system sensor kinase FixL